MAGLLSTHCLAPAVSSPMIRAGTPAASMPSGMTILGGTVQPAATRARRPTIAPSSTVAPLPTRASAPMTAPCTTHRWPMVAPAPISVTGSLPPCSTDPSWTLAPRRTMIGAKSARSTAPYQTEASSSTITSPTRVAVGAIQAVGLTTGWRFSNENSGTRQSCTPARDTGVASVQDDPAIAVQQGTVLGVPGDRPGEHVGLDVTAGLGEQLRLKRVVNAHHVLLDDGPLVKVGRHVMRGGADDLHALGVRLVVGPGTLEARQERVMDVDHPAFHPLADFRGQDLHIAGEDDELGLGLVDEREQCRLRRGLSLRGDRDVMERQLVGLGQVAEVLVVGDDARDVHGQ